MKKPVSLLILSALLPLGCAFAQEEAPAVEEPAPAVEEPATSVEEPAPAVEEPATSVELLEQCMAEGITLMKRMGTSLANAQNTPAAENAAKELQTCMDALRDWSRKLADILQDPQAKDLYEEYYRPEVEKYCLALGELCTRMSYAHYHRSEALEEAVFRLGTELPQTMEMSDNARWSVTGIVLITMLDEKLAGITSKNDAGKAAPQVQRIVDAMQPWRQASRPEGSAQAKRRFYKNYRTYIESEEMNVLTQAKRITYIDYYQVEALALPVVIAQDTVRDICALTPEEHHIRAGIVLLRVLDYILAQVQDTESAHTATYLIMRLSTELNQWGMEFANLPELDDSRRQKLEKRYIPQIDELNVRIQQQAGRLASAEYYRCRELPEALLRLILLFQ